MRRGTRGLATASAVLVLVTAGCAGIGPTACTAIGRTDTVAVEVPGSADPASRVAGVVVCQGPDCTPGVPPEPAVPTAPGEATPGAPAVGRLPDGTAPTAVLPMVERDGDVWSVPTSSDTAGRGRVAVLGADGRVLVERDVRFTWVRHGGSEQCGGPSTAEVVVRLP